MLASVKLLLTAAIAAAVSSGEKLHSVQMHRLRMRTFAALRKHPLLPAVRTVIRVTLSAAEAD